MGVVPAERAAGDEERRDPEGEPVGQRQAQRGAHTIANTSACPASARSTAVTTPSRQIADVEGHRPDGNDQYIRPTDLFAHHLDDPYTPVVGHQ